jgi:iron-sulfur cluster repair protein YtfE (RIC family)
MKATSLLENQHRRAEALLKKLESGVADHAAVLDELANSLAAHMAIEQDIFYPAIKRVNEELVNESYEEHALAEVALKRLMATDPEDEEFLARVTALKELLQHHVQEEEDELFPAVQAAMDKEALEQLGESMQQRFAAVVEAGFEAAVPKGWAKTSADVAKRSASKASKKARSAPASEASPTERSAVWPSPAR